MSVFYEYYYLLIIFVVGILASSFGTLIGGSSLITIPTLILLGLPPHTAIGTDRLGVIGLGIAGWYKFHQKRMINYKIGFIIGIPALFGSLLGASFVLQLNETILKKIIAIITISIAFVIFAKPKIGLERTSHTIENHEYLVGTFLSFLVGIYGGFYGAGAGTLLFYILIILFKQNFLESAATFKIGTVSMAVVSTSIFAINGAISYSFGFPLLMGCLVGSYIGAHYSDRIGNLWIKRLFIVIVLIMVIKLLVS